MRGLLLSFSHRSPILVAGLLVLFPTVLWAQRVSTLEQSAVQLPDAPSRVATVSEAQTSLHLTYKGFPLSFTQNQGKTESWMKFFPDHTDYDRLSINANAVLNPDTGTAEFWGKNNYFIGTAPINWLTIAPTYSTLPDERNFRVENLEQFGQRIPWAGSVIQRIGQQAKAHPHITGVLKTVRPRF